MNRLITYCMITTFLFAGGCISEYEPRNFDQTENIIVVEGYISSGETTVRISLSKSIYGALDEELYLRNIRIWVEGDNGYVSPNSALVARGKFTIETGQLDPEANYRLCFEYENERYESTYQPILNSGTIDNPRLVKEARGEPVHLIVDSEGDNDGNGFWNWRIDERWEVKANLFANVRQTDSGQLYYYDISTSNNIYNCWAHYDNRQMRIMDVSQMEENRLVDHSIWSFEASDDRLSILYWVRIYQYRIDRDAYIYFKNMSDNSEASGDIFSPIPSQIEGNVVCVTDPSRPVIGWVVASEPAMIEKFFWLDEELYEPPVDDCPRSKVKETGFIMYYHHYDEVMPIFHPKIRFSTPSCVDCRLKPHASKDKPEWWPTESL